MGKDKIKFYDGEELEFNSNVKSLNIKTKGIRFKPWMQKFIEFKTKVPISEMYKILSK